LRSANLPLDNDGSQVKARVMAGSLLKRIQEMFAREKREEAEQDHADNLAGTEYEGRKEDVQIDEYFPGGRTVDDAE